MKKLLTFALILVLSMGAYAQTEHMTFVGIPLNGTIDQFQQKLISKGFVVNKEMNTILEKGLRAFKGTFVGEKADITVYYDTKTKQVYSAKSFFLNLSYKEVGERYNYLKNQIQEKYKDSLAYPEEKTEAGLKTFIASVGLGIITIWQDKDEGGRGYPNIYSLHISYTDYINWRLHEENNIDDL